MILVIAEQRGGKLNRATWATIAAAQQLGADTIETRPSGYAIRVSGTLDLERFESLSAQARSAPPAEAIELLREALALFRGPGDALEVAPHQIFLQKMHLALVARFFGFSRLCHWLFLPCFCCLCLFRVSCCEFRVPRFELT